MNTPAPLVSFTRGTLTESTHFGSVAVADAGGRLIAWAGDAERVTTMRSTAKPFQAMTIVETGTADGFGMSAAELAIIAASHNGEPSHTSTVSALLERAGLTPDQLQCGTQPPLHAATREELQASGRQPSTLHHNCSGKHCGMLCACVHRGWDVRTYLRPDHPLQRQNLSVVADMAGTPRVAVGIAVDGCGVPTFALPLVSIATAFARLVDQSPDEHSAAATRVRSAMLAHPEIVAGEGRLDTELMQISGGRVLAKAGAEACYGLGLTDRGWGITLKIEDGGARAVAPTVIETLRQLDALKETELEALRHFASPLVRNYRDEIVGEGRAEFELQRVNGAD